MPATVHTSALLGSSSNSWLITPNVGLTIWTIIVFAISLYILSKVAFPRITKALDERRAQISESIDSAERTRQEADKLLDEYRERLKEARTQADEIVHRARQAADTHEQESKERGQELLAEAAKRAERDIEVATKRALDDLRREVADLTIMATEKVTRKVLDDSDQRRLVEEALNEMDLSGLSSGSARQNCWTSSPVSTPAPCSRWPSSRASSTCCANSSSSSRRRWKRTASSRSSSSRPTSPPRRSRRRSAASSSAPTRPS
jgi:F-type H+-transporting ATPase subunit b